MCSPLNSRKPLHLFCPVLIAECKSLIVNAFIERLDMEESSIPINQLYILERSNFQSLIDALKTAGYLPIGPKIQNGAVILGEIEHAENLPIGMRDTQKASSYKLENDSGGMLFGYSLGPQSWKKYLFPPTQNLFAVKRSKNGWKDVSINEKIPDYAFLGIRPCEIKAIGILDEIFINGEFADPAYSARRRNNFILAVNCTLPGNTCFCASMGTGPRAKTGYDLAVTEIVKDSDHFFLVEIGSEKGAGIVQQIKVRPAAGTEIETAEAVMEKSAVSMKLAVNNTGLKELLQSNIDHSYWDKIASRCLTCGNCTMVCPTCFCTTVEDSTDLQGNEAFRRRTWDSCFTMDYSYIHGGSVRYSSAARYRQWLMHKFANWHDQFGSAGCVGCGRCITWCPAGIDITKEIRAFQDLEIKEKSIQTVKED